MVDMKGLRHNVITRQKETNLRQELAADIICFRMTDVCGKAMTLISAPGFIIVLHSNEAIVQRNILRHEPLVCQLVQPQTDSQTCASRGVMS